MLLTLLLSAGLMASAQQDTPKPSAPLAPITSAAALAATFAEAPIAPDTTVNKKAQAPEAPKSSGKNVMVFSDGNYSYRISGDTLISGLDTLILKGKTKDALVKLQEFNWSEMPEIDVPVPPVHLMEFGVPPIPDFDMEIGLDMKLMAMEPMIPMEPFNFDFAMGSPMPPMMFFSDTTKMSKQDQEKWANDMAKRSEEWAKLAEEKASEWAKRAEEWAAKWEEGEADRTAKIEAWKKDFEPKIKEFEQKMAVWQAAHEPKMKEFEQKVKEWETAQKPKMEEFQKRMEVWQKEHETKLQEFQKLIQSELNKEKNN